MTSYSVVKISAYRSMQMTDFASILTGRIQVTGRWMCCRVRRIRVKTRRHEESEPVFLET